MKEGTEPPGPLVGSLWAVTTPGHALLSWLCPPAFLPCPLLRQGPLRAQPTGRPRTPTPTIPPSHSNPHGWSQIVGAAARVCLVQYPPRAPAPFEVKDLTLGRGRGRVCREWPPGDTWLFAVPEAAEIKRLFSQWERSQGAGGRPGSRPGCCFRLPSQAAVSAGSMGACPLHNGAPTMAQWREAA